MFFISEIHKYNLDLIKKELKGSYMLKRSKLRFLPGVPDHFKDMENLFAELELEEPADGSILMTKTLGSCGEVAHLKDKYGRSLKRILIKGNPGIGKTSLISKLAYDWASGTSKSISEYDLVLVIDLHKIKPGHSLIKSVHDQLLTKVSLDDLKVCTSPELSVLWLFDGYDEAPTKFLDGRCGDFQDIWESTALLANHCVIVTTRLNKVTDFIQKYGRTGQYRHVRVTGFPEKKMVNYVSKHFSLNRFYQWLLPLLFMVIPRSLGYSVIQRSIRYMGMFGQAIDLLLQLNNSLRVKQLYEFPLFLSMICVVWKKKNKLPTSVTSLYRDLIEHLAKFTAAKKDQSETNLDKVYQLLLGTGEIALKKLFLRQFEFSATKKDKHLFDALIKLGVVVEEDRKFTFLHKTFQELCAAVYWGSLAEDNEDCFNEYLRKIDERNYEDMEYLLRLCCGADTEAASLIINHCVDFMGDVLRQSHEDPISDLCFFGVGSPEKNVVNPWKLPLSLLYEAESQGSADSLQDKLEPIVKMIRIHGERIIPDQEMGTIIEHYINKYDTGSSQTWMSFVFKAVCTFYRAPVLDGIYVNLLRCLSKVRVLHINGYNSPFSWHSVCDFSALVRELKTFPAVSNTLTELEIARCSINITALLALLFTLKHSCHVILSIVKVRESTGTQKHLHESTNPIGPLVLQLEGEEYYYTYSDFNLLLEALTYYPSLRESLKEFHCLRLQFKKSILHDYFASLSSFPEKMSFQQVEVGGTRSAPEHLVKYKLGKLTISGTGASENFDCTTWVECFTSCHIALNSLTKFRCIDCFVDAAALQAFFKNCTNIQNLRLHVNKPANSRWGDVELIVDDMMTVKTPDDITKWLRCLDSWCNARYTLKELRCYFGSVNTNELLHFCSLQQSLALVALKCVRLTQAGNAVIVDATNATSTVTQPDIISRSHAQTDGIAPKSHAFSVTHQNLKFDVMRCTMDCISLVNIMTKSPKELVLHEIRLIDTYPSSGYNLISYTEMLCVSGHNYVPKLSETERRESLLKDRSLKDLYNDMVHYESTTFPGYSHVLNTLAHIDMPSLETLLIECCKLTAQSLVKFICQIPHVRRCYLKGVTISGTIASQQTLATSLRILTMVNCNMNVNNFISLLSHHTWDKLCLYQTTISPTTDWFKTVFDEHNGIDAGHVFIYGENSPIPMISSSALLGVPTGTSVLDTDIDKVPDVANTVFYNNYHVSIYHDRFTANLCRFEERE